MSPGSISISRRTFLAGLGGAAVLPGSPAPAQADTASERAEGAKLDALLTQFSRETIERVPEWSAWLGLDGAGGEFAHLKSRLGARSLQSRAAYLSLTGDQLRRLRGIDRAKLAGLDAVNHDVVSWDLEVRDADLRAFDFGTGDGVEPYVLSQLTGSYQSVPDFLDTKHGIDTRQDAESYLARLGAFADVLDGELETARHDAGLGIVPPDFILARTLEQLRPMSDLPAAGSVLVASLARRVAEKGFPGDYARQASVLYDERVVPALRRQVAFVDGLREKAYGRAGIGHLPDGEARYRSALRSGTTTSSSPADIHRLGLDMVASLTGELDAALARQGMAQGTVGERLRALFSDRRFLYPNTDEGKAKLIADLNLKVEALSARLPDWFGTLPRARVEIRRVPREIEAGASSSYQAGSLDGLRPGAYYIVLRDTAEQPSWMLSTLTYHEASPGHHLAIALANETSLPLLRKMTPFIAYDEGWALYAEQLADEMGMYDADPFGRIGYLHDALLRASRLVIDTGLHAFGWSRERAVRYYVDLLGDPDSAAVAEVERYCVLPGQACGYMVGKLTLLRLRAMARDRLGARFDIRRFHDACLLSGAMPLEQLERLVGAYGRG